MFYCVPNKFRKNIEHEDESGREGEELNVENKYNEVESPDQRNILRKANSANSLLGLSLLLHGNKEEYNKWPVWNVANNNYYGFKVYQN